MHQIKQLNPNRWFPHSFKACCVRENATMSTLKADVWQRFLFSPGHVLLQDKWQKITNEYKYSQLSLYDTHIPTGSLCVFISSAMSATTKWLDTQNQV